MFSDLWYRAGWLHAAFDESHNQKIGDKPLDESCPGWLFFLGCCGFCAASDFAGCCMACGAAALRGGISFIDGGDGGLGKIVPMRKRFEMPHTGINTFLYDSLCYCCCGSCIATQEYRQVMELLNRGPVQQETSPPVVQAAVVGATVVGEPVATNKEGAA
mmetsp:Transcript_103607/g.200764  ORF Transcript_103607/g.200764 Transcript_103607/m.200764 type:complete len:160 (+) Transcript_103607:2-481(+)